MKKFLPMLALFIYATATTNAQTGSLLVNENFTSLVSGNLNTTTNPSSGWINTDNDPYIQVANTTPLVYSGYASGTNYVTIQNTAGADDPEKTFIGGTTVNATTSSFYISFVVRVPNAAGTQTANASTRTCFYLQNAAGTQFCNFYIGDNGSGANNLKFGINKTGNTGGSFATANFTFNTTYLVVIRYDFVSGNNNDQMHMWINPSLSAEPSTASANVAITAGTDVTAPSTSAVNRITIEQTTNAATAHFDAFKAAYGTAGASQAANAAFAWSTLSPSGATLPIRIYYFNASKGSGYNSLNWWTECTTPQVTFIIERSTDGVDFIPVNSFIATKERCLQPFDYTDNFAGNYAAVYYRIKVVEDNGIAKYSSVVKISMGKEKGMMLTGVSPNPVTNTAQLTVVSTKKDNIDLQVITMDGKMVYRSKVVLQSGSSVISIDVAALQNGMYTIKGVFGSGAMSTVKFIKQ